MHDIAIAIIAAGFYINIFSQADANIEYIRKDALIEWLEECKINRFITDLQKGNNQELIDKINSL